MIVELILFEIKGGFLGEESRFKGAFFEQLGGLEDRLQKLPSFMERDRLKMLLMFFKRVVTHLKNNELSTCNLELILTVAEFV